MIKRWKIANFKSIRDETELELAPLTIFAGANSSGKSTVLQSILLIAQTLQHKVSSKSVVLNGSLSKLGQFDDLKSTDTNIDQISIGWHCEPTASGVKKINSVECELSFDAITDPLEDERNAYQQQPRLYKFDLNANVTDHDSIDNNVSMCVSYSDEIGIDFIKIIGNHLDHEEAYKMKKRWITNIIIDNISLNDIQKTEPLTNKIYCNDFNHFLPNTIGVNLISSYKIAKLFFNIFFLKSIIPQSTISFMTSKESAQLPKDIIEKAMLPVAILIDLLDELNLQYKSLKTKSKFALEKGLTAQQHKILRKKLKDIPEEMISPRSLNNFVQNLPRKTQKNILNMSFPIEFPTFITMIQDNIKYPSHIKKNIPDYIYDEEIEIRPKILFSAIEYIDHFFSEQVKYLGPLRSEPKYLYPIGTSVDPTDVGVRGEQTAEVLHVHRKTSVEYLPTANFPPSSSELSDIERTPVSKTLMEAVQDWAKYLGVAEDIKASDHGKLGHSIKVGQDRKIEYHYNLLFVDSDDPDFEDEIGRYGLDVENISEKYTEELYSQDLTHVGVGVSQVIPILVMGLLSKEDTTLIFEQPELHLHPLVQTRLADFFLSMALLKKQCIIETHSEHLINRLRFRAASAEEPLTDTSKIYFVEKKEGTSQFREVVINEYGSIEDWPSGFFDQSYTEAEAILMASIKKRKKMRKR